MARLFSIDLPFQNQQYPALMSIRNEGADLFCTVRYIDKRVPYVLAGDTLVINLEAGLKQPHHFPPDIEATLVNCTCQAIELYQ